MNAIHLLQINLKKLTSYRTFWVVCGMYFFILTLTMSSGMEVVKWMADRGAEFGLVVNIRRIPFYHFPDVWQNLTYFGGFFKIILGILVVITITNEFTYRTIRQNIIDGLSRWEFLLSKILTNVVLALGAMVLVFLIATITGLIYSLELNPKFIFMDLEFLPAYFLEVFSFLSYALLLGILIQRSGLTIVVLLFSFLIEYLIRLRMPVELGFLEPWFPMQSISNLIPRPLDRYMLIEIQDYVAIGAAAIALLWAYLFNYFSYLKLKRADL